MMGVVRFLMRRSWAEPHEINDHKNTDGINNEERDEPPLLATTSRMPEGEALESERPYRHDNNKREKCSDKRQCVEMHVEW